MAELEGEEVEFAAQLERQAPIAPVSPQRTFLGWRQPLLHSAADWLIERGQRETLIDLDSILVVVPGRRAGRRLLETLAERALERGAAGLVPPRIVTPGQLMEVLYSSELPVAGELEQLLARLRVLSRARPEELEPLLPRAADSPLTASAASGRARSASIPGFGSWLELARTLERLSGELAIEGLTLPFAAGLLAERLEFPEEERWRVLALIERRTESLLAASGWRSAHRSLIEAGASDAPASDAPASDEKASVEKKGATISASAEQVVLVGVAELGRAFRRLLSAFARQRKSNSEVPCLHALIGAPDSEADCFDDWGRPLTVVWQQRVVDSTSAERAVVDRPRDQTALAIHRLSAWRKAGLDPSQMTVGLGDATAARGLQEALAMAGFRSHSPLGRSLSESRPVRMLEVLSRFVERRDARELAELLRQPDLERVLLRRWSPPPLPENHGLRRELVSAIERRDWLSFLDRYSQETLVRDLRSAPGPRAAAELARQLDHFFVGLAEDAEVSQAPADSPPANFTSGAAPRRLPIDQWSPVLAQLLELVFGDLELHADRERDGELIEALTRLGDLLRKLADLGDLVPEAPVGFSEMVRLTLAGVQEVTLSREQSANAEGAAVEVLGWLELPLDDAPGMVLLHVNEGFLPESRVADPFLPDQVRRTLGLMHNRRRYARDLFLFQSLIESRRGLLLVSGRRSSEDEPLAPSRLLLAGHREDPRSLARTLVGYYDAAASQLSSLEIVGQSPRSLPFPHGDRLEATIPDPATSVDDAALTSLSVTAFRDYLACPYRFYLKQVLRLETVRDLPQELDGRTFGNLAHEVLRRFSLSEASSEQRFEHALDALQTILSAELTRSFGFRQTAALRVQAAQLRRRFELFAGWQVEQLAEGWEVDRQWTERKVLGTLPVDGVTIGVRGKVDRVDSHPQLGYRVVDWKTSDRRREPAAVHRSRGAAFVEWQGWSDLQLPLYRHLLEQTDSFASRPIELGYYLLSADLAGAPWASVPWTDDDHRQALSVAEEVVRRIRQHVFWPPKSPPSWDDGLRWLAWDAVPSGPRLAEAGGRKQAPWPQSTENETPENEQPWSDSSKEGPSPEWPEFLDDSSSSLPEERS